MPDTPEDVVKEAREFIGVVGNCGIYPDHAKRHIASLCGEVDHARRALKLMIELWDANNPDDPCGCVGASDDCKHPPMCELCTARLISEGRTKELFED